MCKISSRSNHTHPCNNSNIGCKNVLKCSDAYLERNYDGYPEVICSFNQEDNIECEQCDMDTECEYCGYPSHLGHELDCIFFVQEVNPIDANIPVEAYDNE